VHLCVSGIDFVTSTGLNLLDATLCGIVSQIFVTNRWISQSTLVSSGTKSNHHNKTEIVRAIQAPHIM
jgi:hypothetical protein